MDAEYTKRELDEKFLAVHERFNQQDKSLEKILEQTTAHNGRMKKLESWQSFLKGGLAVITVLIVPILLFMINSWINHK